MQYIIMFLIVVGLTVADILTGLIKAHIVHGYSSKIMRLGLYHKALEWLVMGTAIGLEIGLTMLGKYYNAPELAAIAGAVTAFTVFLYIMLMELISILENFAEANPEANFAKKLIKKLRKFNEADKDNEEISNDDRSDKQ